MPCTVTVLPPLARLTWLLASADIPYYAIRAALAEPYARISTSFITHVPEMSPSLPLAVQTFLAPFHSCMPSPPMVTGSIEQWGEYSLRTRRILFWGVTELVFGAMMQAPQQLEVCFVTGANPLIHIHSDTAWSYDHAMWGYLNDALWRGGVAVQGLGTRPYQAYSLVPVIAAYPEVRV